MPNVTLLKRFAIFFYVFLLYTKDVEVQVFFAFLLTNKIYILLIKYDNWFKLQKKTQQPKLVFFIFVFHFVRKNVQKSISFFSAIGDGSDVADQDIQGLLNDTGNYHFELILNWANLYDFRHDKVKLE